MVGTLVLVVVGMVVVEVEVGVVWVAKLILEMVVTAVFKFAKSSGSVK